MNKVKNNAVNRVFNNKKVSENIRTKYSYERLIVLETDFLDRIGDVTFTEGESDSAKISGIQSLPELLNIHKEAWTQGFRNQELGPCEQGMFRTNDISTMQPYEVFLGGICDITERSLPFFEGRRYDNVKLCGEDHLTEYQVVLKQYKTILSDNIKSISNQAKKELDELMALGY